MKPRIGVRIMESAEEGKPSSVHLELPLYYADGPRSCLYVMDKRVAIQLSADLQHVLRTGEQVPPELCPEVEKPKRKFRFRLW